MPFAVFARQLLERIIPRRGLSPIQVVAIGFLSVIALGTVLLELPIAQRPGVHVDFLDCLFTATSATCVTGLVVVSTADSWTLFGQIVILAMIQIGGLGYMTIATAVALLLGLRVSFRARLQLQSEARTSLTALPTIQLLAYTTILTLGIELIGALLLALRFHYAHGHSIGRAAFEGIFHSISAFCNAGFDLAPEFLGFSHMPYRLDLWLLITIGLLLFLGGLGFAVLVELFLRGTQRRISLHVKLVLSMAFALSLVGMLAFYLLEARNPQTLAAYPSELHRWVTSWFMSVTTRTAGFASVDLAVVSPPTLSLFSVLMAIGAAPYSTGGGMKTTTIAVVLLTAYAFVRMHPDIEVFRRRISGTLVRAAISLMLAYLLVIMLLVIGLTINEITLKHLPADANLAVRFNALVFEAFSALGTVGLSTGITRDLEPLSRIFIVIAMYLGRLGPLAFVFAFTGSRRPMLRRLPTEPVMTG